LFCAAVEEVPGCMGSLGCCSEFCDVTLGDDEQCTGFPDGQACVPWFEMGRLSPGLEHVGACAVPP
jgi:hypothetical protein